MCVPSHLYFRHIKLEKTSHMRSNLVLLYALSFGPVVHQISR